MVVQYVSDCPAPAVVPSCLRQRAGQRWTGWPLHLLDSRYLIAWSHTACLSCLPVAGELSLASILYQNLNLHKCDSCFPAPPRHPAPQVLLSAAPFLVNYCCNALNSLMAEPHSHLRLLLLSSKSGVVSTLLSHTASLSLVSSAEHSARR